MAPAQTMAPNVQEILSAQRAHGPATILATAIANPAPILLQDEYPDSYFRMTRREHLTELKEKAKKICKNSMIEKRYMHLTEEMVNENPELIDPNVPSLDTRQKIAVVEIPKLAKEAAVKAIEDWGQPLSRITHLVCATSGCVDLPGPDFQLAKLLGLSPSVNRFMISQHGCYAGGTALRLAKNIAENNRGARVLVVCVEIMVIYFDGPTTTKMDTLIAHCIFGDGAAALVMGSDPDALERPIFEIVSATQATIPGTEECIAAHLNLRGLSVHLAPTVAEHICANIEASLVEAMKPLGISDWNSIFYIMHPGGRAILDRIDTTLGLDKSKLRATRSVLRQFGNLSGPSVLFIMDEMRRYAAKEGKSTYGEGQEWGVLFGFGPGITIETLALHALPVKST